MSANIRDGNDGSGSKRALTRSLMRVRCRSHSGQPGCDGLGCQRRIRPESNCGAGRAGLNCSRFSGRVTNQPEKKSAFAEQNAGAFSGISPSFGENWPIENEIGLLTKPPVPRSSPESARKLAFSRSRNCAENFQIGSVGALNRIRTEEHHFVDQASRRPRTHL
jgi:hypothetical protein